LNFPRLGKSGLIFSKPWKMLWFDGGGTAGYKTA
jgi:hypothetical protein